MLSTTPTDLTELENAYDAWRFAADEATDALHGWISGPSSPGAAAFYAYRAALDREEQAARILAQHSRFEDGVAGRSVSVALALSAIPLHGWG